MTERRPLSVAIIGDNPRTIDDLHSYLESAGVASLASRMLAEVSSLPSATSCAVLFPDELDSGDVVRRVLALRLTRPQLLLVIVTSMPQLFRPAFDSDGHSLLPIVLSRPAFGWAILDAIREHAAEVP